MPYSLAGWQRLATPETHANAVFDVAVQGRSKHRPFVAICVVEACGSKAGPFHQIFNGGRFIPALPKTLHRCVQHRLFVEFPRSCHSAIHLHLPPRHLAISQGVGHYRTYILERGPRARYLALLGPASAQQSAEGYSHRVGTTACGLQGGSSCARLRQGRAALYEVKIEELRASFALEATARVEAVLRFSAARREGQSRLPHRLLRRGPIVLTFYRGAGAPIAISSCEPVRRSCRRLRLLAPGS